jgi:type IV secretory pathway protease TraF
MEPTFLSGDKILILNCKKNFLLKRGQIVILCLPNNLYKQSDLDTQEIIFVKRIAGIAGDKEVPNLILDKPISNGEFFVLGDNPDSRDSRHWGTLPQTSILGIVVKNLGNQKKSRT